MSTSTTTASSYLLWFIGRGSGFIAYLLLTIAVLLGITISKHWTSRRWPRLVIDSLHRWSVVLFYVFIAVHTLTMLLDPFSHFSLKDVTIPFGSSYRTFWLGLGVLAAEMSIAIGATFLVRRFISYRLWHWLHLGIYPVFILSLLHSLGTGTDTTEPWATLIYTGSVLAVLTASVWRLSRAHVLRRWVLSGSLLGASAILIWAARGPYAPGWARTSGTPAALLQAAAVQRGLTTTVASSSPTIPLPNGLNSPVAGEALVNRQGNAILLRGQGVGNNPFDVAIQLINTGNRITGQVQLRTAQHVPWCAGSITGIATGNTIDATCSGYGQHINLRIVIRSLSLQAGGWSGLLVSTSSVGAS